MPPRNPYAFRPYSTKRAATQTATGPPGSIGNPYPGGTGAAATYPGSWVAADQRPFEGVQRPYGSQPVNEQMGGTGGGGGGGFGPGYDQFLSQLNAMGALDASRRQELVQQALIRFGLVPENLKDPYGDVTGLVRQLAGEKTTSGTSTYARIQDWNKQTLSRLRKALAARGALRSGELRHGLERQDLGYRQNFDDAISQLLDYISGAQYGFAQSELGRTMQQASAAQSFFDPYAGGGGGGGGGGSAGGTATGLGGYAAGFIPNISRPVYGQLPGFPSISIPPASSPVYHQRPGGIGYY